MGVDKTYYETIREGDHMSRHPTDGEEQELDALARRAVESMDARKDEDIVEWAEGLADDVVPQPGAVERVGNKEYGRIDCPEYKHFRIGWHHATTAERERCASEIERILKEWVQSPSKIKACPHIASEGAVFFGLWCSMCLAAAIQEGE